MLAQPLDENLMRILITDTNSGKENIFYLYKGVDSDQCCFSQLFDSSDENRNNDNDDNDASRILSITE